MSKENDCNSNIINSNIVFHLYVEEAYKMLENAPQN